MPDVVKKVKIVDEKSNPNETNQSNDTNQPSQLKEANGKSFADALKEQIVNRKKTAKAKRLLQIIDGPKTKRRERILERLEKHARLHLKDAGLKNAEEIQDWSQVSDKDWSSFFDGLLKFITAILPIILALFGM